MENIRVNFKRPEHKIPVRQMSLSEALDKIIPIPALDLFAPRPNALGGADARMKF